MEHRKETNVSVAAVKIISGRELHHNRSQNRVSLQAMAPAAVLPAQVFSSSDRLRRTRGLCQSASNEQRLRFTLSSPISRVALDCHVVSKPQERLTARRHRGHVHEPTYV